MIDRRVFLQGAIAVGATSPVRSNKMVGTIAFTFDTYASTVTKAFPIMSARGLVGTFFVIPSQVNPSLSPVAGQVTLGDLILMKQSGWEIGIYLQGSPDMETMQVSNRNTAYNKLISDDAAMTGLGFKVSSVAPNSRKWNAQLANMARGRWKCVRANSDVVNMQSYPIMDQMWIKQGGAPSWGNTHTDETICAQLDRVAGTSSFVAEIVHDIGPSSDSLCVSESVFTAAMDHAVQLRASGAVRFCTMEQALSPP